MEVYIVGYPGYDGIGIEEIFLKEKDAKSYQEENNKGDGFKFDIFKYEVK